MRSELHFIDRIARIKVEEPYVAICDRRLRSLFIERFPHLIAVDSGETLKTLSSTQSLALRVLAIHKTRNLTLVAIGGGSVGDAVGFLASILWRGVNLVHVPTTLLSMVDSAHGGKTAVNLPGAKNQLGTIYPAATVWIVKELVASLPKPLLNQGLTELFKTALLGKPSLVKRWLKRGDCSDMLWPALKEAINVKLKICARDPREKKGIRELLNLGHTLGHALETSSGLPHGVAVGWGLIASALVSERFGFKHRQAIERTLRPLLYKPQRWPSEAAISKALSYDKKTDRTLRSIVLKDFGKAIVTREVSTHDWIQAYRTIKRLP